MYINYRPLQCITLRLAVLAIFSVLLVIIVVLIVIENKTLAVTSDFHAGVDTWLSGRTLEKRSWILFSHSTIKMEEKNLTKSLCLFVTSWSRARHIDERSITNWPYYLISSIKVEFCRKANHASFRFLARTCYFISFDDLILFGCLDLIWKPDGLYGYSIKPTSTTWLLRDGHCMLWRHSSFILSARRNNPISGVRYAGRGGSLSDQAKHGRPALRIPPASHLFPWYSDSSAEEKPTVTRENAYTTYRERKRMSMERCT